jgi:hypothetical protein
LLLLLVAALAPACSVSVDPAPDCSSADSPLVVLAAQAVPSATVIPCLVGLTSGWTYAGSETTNGEFHFWLSSDRAGVRAVEVLLRHACDVSGAVEVTPSADEAGTRRFEEPLSLSPRYSADRFYTFPGGCVEVEYRFGSDDSTLVLQADQAIGFRPRQPVVDRLDRLGLVLCGAGAAACADGR